MQCTGTISWNLLMLEDVCVCWEVGPSQKISIQRYWTRWTALMGWEYLELPCLYWVFLFIAWLTVGELCRVSVLDHQLCSLFEWLYSHLWILGCVHQKAWSQLSGLGGTHRQGLGPHAGEVTGSSVELCLVGPVAAMVTFIAYFLVSLPGKSFWG